MSEIQAELGLPSYLVHEWVGRFNAALAAGDPQQFAALFADESYWRDLLALTGDIRTFAGGDLISASLPGLLAKNGVTHLQLEDRAPRIEKLEPLSETSGVFFPLQYEHRPLPRLCAHRF